MNGRFILDADGQPKPCEDLLTWGRWMGRDGSRVVEQTTVGDVKVSTVFLGLDHRFDRPGDPILWETMIFGGPHDGYQERFTSRADALAGHDKALQLVQTVEQPS